VSEIISRKADEDKTSSSVLINVTKSMRDEIKETAKALGLNINSFVRMAIAKELNSLRGGNNE